MKFFLLFVFILFSFLHVYKIGTVSTTWDEGTDITIVQCYAENLNPFGCMDDVSQTRLPYYIHAAAMKATNGSLGGNLHYFISFVFGLFILFYMYWFVKREFGQKVAVLSTLLLLFSIPQLAMSRMILTHSNIIFTAWVVLSMTMFYFALKTERLRFYILAAFFWGLTVSSSILGIFLGIFFILFYLLSKKPSKKTLFYTVGFVLLGIGAFFLASICYLDPKTFNAFITNLKESRGVIYPYWNYFALGSPQSPWWFSWLIFVVKLTPWWTAMLALSIVLFIRRRNHLKLHHMLLVAATLFLFLYFILKSAIFKYDAPHHQAPFYLFIYVAIAYGIVEIYHRLQNNRQILFSMLIGLFFCLQIADVFRFFPTYLFYGAQYGKQFIGEFYGPAVLHCYDEDKIDKLVEKLAAQGEHILVPDHSCMRLPMDLYTVFSARSNDVNYTYAFADYLYMNHFNRPGREEYKRYLAEHCWPYYSYYFPTNVPVYSLYKCGK